MKAESNVNQAMVGHLTTWQIIKFVAPTIVTVVFASLYGIVDGILAVCRALVFSIGAVLILIRQLSKKGSCRFLNFVIQL